MLYYLTGMSTERSAVLAYNELHAGTAAMGEQAIAQTVIEPDQAPGAGTLHLLPALGPRVVGRARGLAAVAGPADAVNNLRAGGCQLRRAAGRLRRGDDHARDDRRRQAMAAQGGAGRDRAALGAPPGDGGAAVRAAVLPPGGRSGPSNAQNGASDPNPGEPVLGWRSWGSLRSRWFATGSTSRGLPSPTAGWSSCPAGAGRRTSLTRPAPTPAHRRSCCSTRSAAPGCSPGSRPSGRCRSASASSPSTCGGTARASGARILLADAPTTSLR